MRSVRFGEELEGQLERLAERTGQPASEIIRRAVRKHCGELLGETTGRLADLVGKFTSKGRRSATKLTARDSGRAFSELLEKSAKSKRRSRR